MNTPLIIILCIFGAVLVGTIAANIILSIYKERQYAQHFSKEKMAGYERDLREYLRRHNVTDKNVYSVLRQLGYQVEKKDRLDGDHEAYIDGNVVLLDKTLGFRARNFSLAHEIGHIVRKSHAEAARDPHSFKTRTAEEQICDYYAAALLLPLEEMAQKMDACEYDSLSKRERMKFVKDVAEEKDVYEEVVIRRISEVKVLR